MVVSGEAGPSETSSSGVVHGLPYASELPPDRLLLLHRFKLALDVPFGDLNAHVLQFCYESLIFIIGVLRPEFHVVGFLLIVNSRRLHFDHFSSRLGLANGPARASPTHTNRIFIIAALGG